MRVERSSHCKVNFLLNILGKREDGFHELETLLYPIRYADRLEFTRISQPTIQLSCSDPRLPTNSSNLVVRAAELFKSKTGIADGVQIHLEKNIPLAAGLGGGSGNAAQTLLAMNELFGNPVPSSTLTELAAQLGSDIPFFLQDAPAIAVGRGEQIQPLAPFGCLKDYYFLLIHPGFGIATAWAYQALGRFPKALRGEPGRAQRLAGALHAADFGAASHDFYNSLEAPALYKFPILSLYQEFLRNSGALIALMSGSGSTTFALVHGAALAEQIGESFKSKFGRCWLQVVSAV